MNSAILELSVSGVPYKNLMCPQFSETRELDREQYMRIATAAVQAGFSRIVITGHEPLMRVDLLDILYDISKISGLHELGLSTGGAGLSSMASAIKGAGVSLLEIRLETMQRVKAEFLCNDKIQHISRGISAAEKTGFFIRIVTRIIGGVNDDEILDFTDLVKRRCVEQHFVELPTGDPAFVPYSRVLDLRRSLEFIDERDGAMRYHFAGTAGKICLSHADNPTRHFVSADGMLGDVSLLSLGHEDMVEAFKACFAPRAVSFGFSVIEE